MSDILPESGLIYHIQWQNFLLADFFRKTPVGKSDIFHIFEMSKLVSAMVSRSIFLRHYFVWYIAWKWSQYIFSNKISYLQNFSEKTLCGRVIYFIFLKWPHCCPQWCRDGFLIKALFCLIYCLKVVSSIHIQWQNFLLADFFRRNPCAGEWYILYFWDVQIDVRNGVEIGFLIKALFCLIYCLKMVSIHI